MIGGKNIATRYMSSHQVTLMEQVMNGNMMQTEHGV